MDFASERYYRPSGVVPLGGILLTLVVGIGGGTFLGIAYAAVINYIPFVIFSVMGLMVFAGGLGRCIDHAATIGKIRNRTILIVIGLICGIVGWYVSWVAFLWFLTEMPPVFNMLPLLDPVVFFSTLGAIGEQGLWERMPSGTMLYLLWGGEAVFIIGGALLIPLARKTPFCERCECWTEKQAYAVRLGAPEDLLGLRMDLEGEQYSKLHDMFDLPSSPFDCAIARTWMCPQCEETTYMSIDQIVTTVNSKGEECSSTTAIVTHLVIPRKEAETLFSRVTSNPMESLHSDTPEESQPDSIPLAETTPGSLESLETSESQDEDFWSENKA